MQLHTLEPVGAPRVMTGALSPEVFTVSTLLSMPAVWTSVVEHDLPFDTLLERYLIVLLSIALIAELFRRLGEGGGILAPVDGATARLEAGPVDPYASDDSVEASPLGHGDVFDSPLAGPLDADLDLGSPLALDAPAVDGFGLDAALGDLGELGDLNDLGDLGGDFDLAPLDLNADPFADPA